MKVDVVQLSGVLADGLRRVAVDLEPIGIQCAWPVFKATSIGCAPLFVKVTDPDAARRAQAFLSGASGTSFLPKPILSEPIPFNGFEVLCLEWKEATRVNAEDMTEGQLGSFAAGCRQLSEILERYRGPVTPLAKEDAPERQHAALADYAQRHRFVGRLLQPLLSVPASERTFGGRELSIIHGDLQPKNYGFDGDRLAAVYDTDDLTVGLACEDAAYAFTERARRAELPAPARQRLTELFLRLVGMSSWPRDEWLIAVNRARLRIAARRLANHPDSSFIAFDIWRRDKPLAALARALKGELC